jgi:hypothetical protein
LLQRHSPNIQTKAEENAQRTGRRKIMGWKETAEINLYFIKEIVFIIDISIKIKGILHGLHICCSLFLNFRWCVRLMERVRSNELWQFCQSTINQFDCWEFGGHINTKSNRT